MLKPEKNYAQSKASLLVYINVSFRMFYYVTKFTSKLMNFQTNVLLPQ